MIGPADSMLSWDGAGVGGASVGETTCVEGINCDTYALNVSSGSWAGKIIAIKITWTIPANDYDLYVHFDANNDGVLDSSDPVVGSAGDGAPETEEATTIDPSSTGVGRYFVHAVCFSVTPGDQYHGTATVQNKPAARNATYLKGGITFSSSVTVKAPVADAMASRAAEQTSLGITMSRAFVEFPRVLTSGISIYALAVQRTIR
jgi:hypothetical protein